MSEAAGEEIKESKKKVWKALWEDRARKWLKEDSKKENQKEKGLQWHFLKRIVKREPRFYKRGGRRRKKRSDTDAPAGAVCWEQVVYLGQHIASSAFPPTCLSKQGRKGAGGSELHY